VKFYSLDSNLSTFGTTYQKHKQTFQLHED